MNHFIIFASTGSDLADTGKRISETFGLNVHMFLAQVISFCIVVFLLYRFAYHPILAMLAFSIDAGYMVLVRTDLQNAADSAALAGAEKMQELWVQYYTPGQPNQSGILTSATTNTSGSPMATAERFATYNRAGNVNLTLLDQDVHFGFTNASGTYSTSYAGFPNTIEVTVRRDEVANGPLALFFARVLGMSSVDIQATARVLRRGRNLVYLDVEVHSVSGNSIARGLVTYKLG